MSKRSRRERRFEKDLRKNILFSLLGIIVIIFIVFKFGIPLLVNFSLLIAKSGPIEQQKSDASYLPAPVLDPLPSATNSAKILIRGQSSASTHIDLYINDSIVDSKTSDKKGEFSFEEDLSEGSNKIAVRAKFDKKESDFSGSFEVSFDNKPPDLSIDSPTDGQSFAKDQQIANVSGKTEEGVKITVNGFWAIVDESNSYSYKLPLQNGENKIRVEALDLAGNKSEKEIKVTYSP